jgi:hypothetical protein
MNLIALKELYATLQHNRTAAPSMYRDAFCTATQDMAHTHLPQLARAAAGGSTDASRELHATVLPKRTWTLHPCVAYTHTDDTEYASTGQVFGADGRAVEDPGRAHFFAILEALIEDLEAAPAIEPDEAPVARRRERVLVDGEGDLRIDELVEHALMDDALISCLQHIMLHHTRRRPDGSSYMLYGSAAEDLRAFVEAMKDPTPHPDNWLPVERMDRREPWGFQELVDDHDERCDEIERLRDCLRRANANHERYERLFLMMRDRTEDAMWLDYSEQTPPLGVRFVYICSDHCTSGMALMTESGALDAEDMMSLDDNGPDWWRGARWSPLPEGYEMAFESNTGD